MKKKSSLKTEDFVYSWGNYDFGKRKITVFDTTLRDGLQSPQAQRQPTLPEKINFLEKAVELGIEAIEIGFPISSESHKKEVIALAKHVEKNKLNILLSCLARTAAPDIEAIADIVQKSGAKVTANILIGSSKIRRLVEDWDIKQMIKWIKKSIVLAQRNNLNVEFVTEDTTRTNPETIKILYEAAIEEGVKRIWIADTVGESVPYAAKKITKFFRKKIIKNRKIGLDWHGHDDKGLGVANSLAAISAGADRIQATALGIGERAGNTPMEPIIINLVLANSGDYNLKKLHNYSKTASKMFNIPIRENYPGVGKYVHSTAAGMHAAAILKAKKIGRGDLEGIVYAPFHPKIFQRETEILVGPMSGRANVEWKLKKLGLKASPKEINIILWEAKEKNRFISDDEIKKILQNS